jgi:hypothetical protein
MVTDEARLAPLQTSRWDLTLQHGVPLVAGAIAAGMLIPVDALTSGTIAYTAGLEVIVAAELVPFVVLAFVAFALSRGTVLLTSVLLAGATVWMQVDVARSHSSTAAVDLVVFPVELCGAPLVVVWLSRIVAGARRLLQAR